MHSFMVLLLTCSLAMSLIASFYMVLNPLLARWLSEKLRYYAWLIILIGLIIPIRPVWSGALIRVGLPSEAVQPMIQIGNEQAGGAMPITFLPLSAQGAPFAYAARESSPDWWQAAFAIWLVGLIVFISVHLVNHYYFMNRVKRWSKNIADEKSNMLFENLKAEMGISKQISLLECEGVGSPMMLGFVKPKILLPSADLADDELRFILKHELVHYKRGDLFFKSLVLLATAMHWFNPAVYMAARAINALGELSCDAEIVQNADDDTRKQYSETLIGVVRYKSRFKTVLSTNFYGGKKDMKNRITSIMTTNKKKATFGSIVGAFALVAVLGVGTLTAFAAERPQTETKRIIQNFAGHVSGAEGGFVRFISGGSGESQTTIGEHVSVTSSADMEIFRVSLDGSPGVISLDGLSESFITKEGMGELIIFDGVHFSPRVLNIDDINSYEFRREMGQTPIYDENGEILMWIPQFFFEMSYDEFNELAELLGTLIVHSTQEVWDMEIIRAHLFAAE